MSDFQILPPVIARRWCVAVETPELKPRFLFPSSISTRRRRQSYSFAAVIPRPPWVTLGSVDDATLYESATEARTLLRFVRRAVKENKLCHLIQVPYQSAK